MYDGRNRVFWILLPITPACHFLQYVYRAESILPDWINSIHRLCGAAHEEERDAAERGDKEHSNGKPGDGFEGEAKPLHDDASKEHSQSSCRQIYGS